MSHYSIIFKNIDFFLVPSSQYSRSIKEKSSRAGKFFVHPANGMFNLLFSLMLVMYLQEMEDNPGHVTNEMEEKYNSLKLETQLMKIELTRMTGETFEFDSSSKNAKLEKSSSLPKESTEYEDDYDNYYDEEFADEDEKDKRKHEASDMLQPDAEPHSNSPKVKIDSQSTPQKNLQYTDKQMPDKLPTPTSVTEISSGLSEKHTVVDAEEEEDAYGNEEFDDFED